MHRQTVPRVASLAALIALFAGCEARGPGDLPSAPAPDAGIQIDRGPHPQPIGGAIESNPPQVGAAGSQGTTATNAGTPSAGSGGIGSGGTGFTGSGGTGFTGSGGFPGFSGTGGTGFTGITIFPGTFTGTGGTGFDFTGNIGASPVNAGAAGSGNPLPTGTSNVSSRAASPNAGLIIIFDDGTQVTTETTGSGGSG